MKRTSIRLPSNTTEVEINEIAVRAKISTYLAAKSTSIDIEDERTAPTSSFIDDKEMQPSAVVVSRNAEDLAVIEDGQAAFAGDLGTKRSRQQRVF